MVQLLNLLHCKFQKTGFLLLYLLSKFFIYCTCLTLLAIIKQKYDKLHLFVLQKYLLHGILLGYIH